MITCRYCTGWETGKSIKNVGDAKTPTVLKKCYVTNKEVKGDDDICDLFEPVKYFYCIKSNQRVNINACLNRRLKSKDKNSEIKFKECSHCKQYSHSIAKIKRFKSKQNIPIKRRLYVQKKGQDI